MHYRMFSFDFRIYLKKKKKIWKYSELRLAWSENTTSGVSQLCCVGMSHHSEMFATNPAPCTFPHFTSAADDLINSSSSSSPMTRWMCAARGPHWRGPSLSGPCYCLISHGFVPANICSCKRQKILERDPISLHNGFSESVKDCCPMKYFPICSIGWGGGCGGYVSILNHTLGPATCPGSESSLTYFHLCLALRGAN